MYLVQIVTSLPQGMKQLRPREVRSLVQDTAAQGWWLRGGGGGMLRSLLSSAESMWLECFPALLGSFGLSLWGWWDVSAGDTCHFGHPIPCSPFPPCRWQGCSRQALLHQLGPEGLRAQRDRWMDRNRHTAST